MSNKFAFNDLFNFEKLIAPSIIKLVYFIGLGLIGLGFILAVVSGLGMMTMSFALGLGYIVAAILFTAMAVLMWRIMMEMYMTFFGIYERLGDVRDRLPPQ